jgi:enoyl-[acyl-carrier protein] reductase I
MNLGIATPLVTPSYELHQKGTRQEAGNRPKGLLSGLKGLVFGIANERSIASQIARHCIGEGAICAFPHLPGDKNHRRARQAVDGIGIKDPWLLSCDVTRDGDLDGVIAAAGERFGTIDFVVHSIAFADRTYLRPGRFVDTPREVFAQALDVSAYSLVAIARRARSIMPAGGAILALTYYGSEKVVPGYNVMGVAKAALEASTRYLAAELGESGIRVNTISAGPIRTLSSVAVSGLDQVLEWVPRKAPLRRNIDSAEVAKTAVYLLSDLASGVTGENIHVDAGYHVVA